MCKGYIKGIESRTKINAQPLNLVRPFLGLACSLVKNLKCIEKAWLLVS